MNEHGLSCVVVRSDGFGERSLHVNDVLKLKEPPRTEIITEEKNDSVMRERKDGGGNEVVERKRKDKVNNTVTRKRKSKKKKGRVKAKRKVSGMNDRVSKRRKKNSRFGR